MIYPDLLAAKKYIYDPVGFKCNKINQEPESKEYSASTFEMNGKHIIFRAAKITPAKVGQFVTLWKRIGNGPIMPYDADDCFDIVVVNVSEKEHFGQFVFPKEALLKHGVISQFGKGGKRAIRVYPRWDVADNKQAQKTQNWQLNYFFEFDKNKLLDVITIQKLYGRKLHE